MLNHACRSIVVLLLLMQIAAAQMNAEEAKANGLITDIDFIEVSAPDIDRKVF